MSIKRLKQGIGLNVLGFLFLLSFMSGASFSKLHAQKYALVDMEYILKNIPDYQMMQQQLNEASKKWQNEVQAQQNQVKEMYKKYQADEVFLSPEQKQKRQNEILDKEKAATELQRKYFAPEGELFKKRQALMKPIQDAIWEAVKSISKRDGFQLVLDRGSAGVIFANPAIDISDQVLAKMGYSSNVQN